MRFSYNDVDNYGNNGNSNFFQLQNDGDTARVRFMYRNINDVEGLAVHEIKIGDKRRYVNCVREYTDPIDKCPLCKANYKVIAKLFVPIYNEETGEVLIWERGKKFFSKITDLCGRYDNLVSQVFEIVRHGKPKDTQTTYEIWPIGSPDNTTLEDLPEAPKVLGSGIVLDKTPDEMDYFLRYGDFPNNSDNGGFTNASDDVPFREDVTQRRPQQSAPMRRTPSRGDAF